MTRYYRGDLVTVGDPHRTWTVQSVDGRFVTLRDDRQAICSVPASSLHLIRPAPPGPIWVAIGAVFAFATVCVACVISLARGLVVLDKLDSVVLLSIASVETVAWMAWILRGVWRRQ